MYEESMSGRRWRPGRQTPRVKAGAVQKKHRWDYYEKEHAVRVGDGELPIVWEPAVRGCRHLVSEGDLRKFVGLVPQWPEYSVGLRGLVLGDGDDDSLGWHDLGVICINAWDSEIEQTWDREFFDEHQPILDRLMVPYELGDADVYCEFTKKTAAAFLLMHVFLHELGHHYDRMQTRAKMHSPKGEPFAESFGNELADRMWIDYFRAFGH